MQLERLAIILRQRSGYEAIDLGFRMAITWWRSLYAVWFAVTIPAVMLIVALSFAIGSWWALLLWIWLKPVFDRAALHVLSRKTFGETISLRATLREIKHVWRNSKLLRALTYARLHPCRSLLLPIDQLEGLRGGKVSTRRSLIANDISGSAIVLTTILFCIEITLAFSAIGIQVANIVPMPSDGFLAAIRDEGQSIYEHLAYFPWFLILSSLLLEPLYVAAGFSLYIKRRNDLEAWDIEIQLRRLHKKQRERDAKSNNIGRISMLVVLCSILSLSAFMPHKANATPFSEREQAVKQADAILKKILKQPEYGTAKKQREWAWKESPEDKNQDLSPDLKTNPFEGLIDVFAKIVRILAWLAIATIITFLLSLIIKHFGSWSQQNSAVYIPPAEVAGLDIRPESLPEDVSAAAINLLNQDNYRATLGLLFRASLSVLAHRDHVPFVRGNTEIECLILVRKHAASCADFFAQLTHNWQQIAYANLPPDREQLKQLCLSWSNYFKVTHEK